MVRHGPREIFERVPHDVGSFSTTDFTQRATSLIPHSNCNLAFRHHNTHRTCFMSAFVTAGRFICFLLGIFEFISAVQFYFQSEQTIEQNKLNPDILGTNEASKILFCTYLITLGIQRLSWALGNGGFIPWLLLLLTHLVEWGMWCGFAFLPRFRGDSTLNELFHEVATLQSPGGPHAFVVLILLPVLILFFLLMGPSQFQTKQKSKSH